MVWGVRWYLVGSVMLGALGVLAGCSGGFFGAEREAWRHEAEVQCLASGAVKESAGVVRIQSINGPGMCGADFPLKVAVLGEGGSLGYSDEVRPPGVIPNASQQPRWPVAPPTDVARSRQRSHFAQSPECGEFDGSTAERVRLSQALWCRAGTEIKQRARAAARKLRHLAGTV